MAAEGAPCHWFPAGRGGFLCRRDLGKVLRQGLGQGRGSGLGRGNKDTSSYLRLEIMRPNLRLGFGVESTELSRISLTLDMRLPDALPIWPLMWNERRRNPHYLSG